MVIHDNSTSTSRTLMPQIQVRGMARPLLVGILLLIVCRASITDSFFLQTTAAWDCFPTDDIWLLRLASLPPHATEYNKLTEFPGCWCISITVYNLPNPNFFFLFFSSPIAQLGQSLSRIDHVSWPAVASEFLALGSCTTLECVCMSRARPRWTQKG